MVLQDIATARKGVRFRDWHRSNARRMNSCSGERTSRTVRAWIDTESGMVWTADKARIVYATSTSHSTTAVESYRIADGANDVVVKSAEGQITHLTASPDGRYAVFQRHSGSSDAVLLTVTR